MRKIAITMGSYHDPAEKIFYKQAKFMEDFEDHFDEQGEFYRHLPTYQDMNDHQLRGYFSWRADVRRGVIEKTSISFVFVYVYELLNQIGVHSPEDGFYALKNFQASYKDIDPYIDSYIDMWLKDYIVYNNLDKSLFENLPDTGFNNTVSTLINHKSHGADEVFSALCFMSSYNLMNSRFYKQYPGDVKNVTCAVFNALSDYYEKKSNDALCEKFFGKFYTRPYYMFKSAVFYDRIRHKDFVYEINEFYKYRCRDGNWICKSFFRYGGRKNRQIMAMLKNIDSLMRKKYSFEPAIKAEETTALMHAIITRAIDEYQEKQREAAQSEIEIDVSMLQNIRKVSLETQNKLLVEEPEEIDAPESSDKKAAPENDAGLSETEFLFMKCLLYDRSYNELVRSKGLPLSVLVDAVNEKLFDRFNDTVIIDTEGRPELIADYIEDLKEIIRK